MCSGRGDGQLHPPGFPIRKPPDRRLVADSPGLIAGSCVLHRLLVPRHPPCALNNLANYRLMLASTMQFSKYGRATGPRAAAHPGPAHPARKQNARPGAVRRGTGPSRRNSPAQGGRSLRTQQRARPGRPRSQRSVLRTGVLADIGRRSDRIASAPLTSCHPRTSARDMALGTPPPRAPCQMLLRKEVIQPHLPVRLPCYDFVPIAGPTFDGSPPYGLGHRLRVLPTFMT